MKKHVLFMSLCVISTMLSSANTEMFLAVERAEPLQVVHVQHRRHHSTTYTVPLPNFEDLDDDTSWDAIDHLELHDGDAIVFRGQCSLDLAILLHVVFQGFNRAVTLYFTEIAGNEDYDSFQAYAEEELQAHEYRITTGGYESGHGVAMHPGSIALYLVPQAE